MRLQINRCDVCGADDTPENRVSVRVTGVGGTAQPPEVAMTMLGVFGWCRSESAATHDVDLCQRCGAGLLDIVRTRQAQRQQALTLAEKTKPARRSTFMEYDQAQKGSA
jgi:hypothetical protein